MPFKKNSKIKQLENKDNDDNNNNQHNDHTISLRRGGFGSYRATRSGGRCGCG